MPRQACKTVFKFNELSDEAKERAIEKWNETGLDYEWWDLVFDDAKNIGALMGIKIENIYFSGFWSQGDGACFEGSYEYKKGSVKAVEEEAPQDKNLHAIAKGLREVQARNFYGLSAGVKQSGHYSHEHCTVIDVADNRDNAPWRVSDEVQEAIAELLRDFMRWIYRTLEQEYEYQTSVEQVADTLQINEYDFLENGTMYY